MLTGDIHAMRKKYFLRKQGNFVLSVFYRNAGKSGVGNAIFMKSPVKQPDI